MSVDTPDLDKLIGHLVIANRALAQENVVDAYGHVSVRHPHRPDRFFIARSLAPELVTREDIVELDLSGEPVATEDRALYLERSEEHTSELQSLMRISYAVFCLKKKKTTNTTL